MSQFIVVTRVAGDQRFPGHRVAVAHILGYGPGDRPGAVIYLGTDDWPVAETVAEIDALIGGPVVARAL
jgi:hypothetical protein